MRYAAKLDGEDRILEIAAKVFNGDHARIAKAGDLWCLHSVEFDECANGQAVFPLADVLLLRIHCVLSLYLSLYSPFSIETVIWFNDGGKPIKQSVRLTATVNVYSIGSLSAASNSDNCTSTGVSIVTGAARDESLSEALFLVGDKEMGWPQIYDVIEFLGGVDAIVRLGFANRTEVRRVRQTANHYRHLGRRSRPQLPDHPPSIGEARRFAADLMKRWIASHLLAI